MCRWAGVDHYFGTDFARAQATFLDPASDHAGSLARWLEWRARRAGRARSRPPKRLTVAALLEAFLEHYSDERREGARSYHAKHLRRFANAFGPIFCDELDAAALLAFRSDLMRDEAGYAPRTIAHDLGAVKTMLSWGADNLPGQVPQLNLRAVRKPRLPPPRPSPLDPATVRRFIEHCERADPRLGPWLRVNYLTFARPSEVVRLVAGSGVWEPAVGAGGGSGGGGVVDRAIFRLYESKSYHATGEPRRLVVSDGARMWLECCRPHWSRLDSYSAAVRRCLGPSRVRPPWLPSGPRVLRHSAASNLHRLGVERSACDLLLGHLPSRVSLTYNPIDWRALWESAGRLTV